MTSPDGTLRLPDGTQVTRLSTTETTGDWLTEAASADAFEAAVAPSGLFRIYREVTGTLTQPRPEQVAKAMRIDRVLIPTQGLVALGWTYGAVGVEIKRSGVRIGPPLAQAMDYTRGAWLVQGVLVHLGAVFLWPCDHQTGPLSSLMVHNRIGTVTPSRSAAALFVLGPETILRIGYDGRAISPYTGAPSIGDGRSGRKVGSR